MFQISDFTFGGRAGAFPEHQPLIEQQYESGFVRLRWAYTTEREFNSALLFPHMAVLFLFRQLRLYWERTWRIILRDSSFTRLTISIDNRDKLLNAALLFPACTHSWLHMISFRQSYVFIGKEWLIIFRDSVSSSLFLRAKLHKLHIRHLFNTSNLCINGCYVK